MAKQEVLDAINATIVSNGIKGITADSLRNVLTLMVENGGEDEGENKGSGDGMLRIHVPELMITGEKFLEQEEFSRDTVEVLKDEIETNAPEMLELWKPVFSAFEEAFVHNAEVYSTIKEKARNGEGCVVSLDQSMLMKAFIECEVSADPDFAASIKEYIMSCVQVANVYIFSLELITGQTEEAFWLIPTNTPSEMGFYPSNMGLVLTPDGSILFAPLPEEEQPSSGSGVVTFYMLGGGVHQDDTTKAMNKKSYDAFWAYDGLPAVNILANIGESYTKNDGFEAMYPIVVAGAPNEDIILQTSQVQFEISSDGNMVFSDIPTA